jgi:adenylate cyclase
MEPFDPLRFGPAPTLTGPEVAERAGMSLDYAKRVFRALGLPEVPDDAVRFDDRDVEVLSGLRAFLDQGFSDEEIIQVARTYGYGLSRIAQAEVRLFRKTFVDPQREQGASDEEIATRVLKMYPALLELLNEQLEHVHRRHLALALEEVVAADVRGQGEVLTAGFVDLVDFTRISRDLAGEDLGELVSNFESLALDTCVEHGARLVKMIGDAVMFTAANPATAVETALTLVAEVDRSSVLPAARAGLDVGEAISVGGDFFGRPVNVAARLTAFARPSTVVVSKEVVEALPQPAAVSRIGPQRLKGVGSVRLYKVNSYPAPVNEGGGS